MPQNDFRPRPGRMGTSPFYLQGSRAEAATPLAVNATTTVQLGGPAFQAYISKAGVSAGTVPVDADGTILATLKKRNGATTVTLSAALDLETLVANVQGFFVFLSTLSEAQRNVMPGDLLYVEVQNNSAGIDTQPVGLVVTAELLARQ